MYLKAHSAYEFKKSKTCLFFKIHNFKNIDHSCVIPSMWIAPV